MKQLKESILSDMDDALSADNAYQKLYPVPRVSDFKKNIWGGSYIDWICPNLIQEYIHYLNPEHFGNYTKPEDITGFKIDVMNKYEVTLYLIVGNDYTGYNRSVSFVGFGADGSSMPNQKKAAIEFFKYILKNPSALKTIFEYENKRYSEFTRNGMCDSWTFKRLLNY